MRATQLATVLALLTLVLSGLAPPVAAQEPTDEAAPAIDAEEGTVDADDADWLPGIRTGWQYVKIQSPRGDAFVAVVYGKGTAETDKGAIWVVHGWTRVVGAVQGQTTSGDEPRPRPVAVRQFNVQRLDTIIEFQDQNQNGIADLVRSNRPISPDQVIAHEPVYKAASLRADWQKEESSSTTEDDDGTTVRVWTLKLHATDLPYTRLNRRANASQTVGDNLVNDVIVTFELRGWREETTVTVPLFQLSVDRSTRPAEVKAERLQDRVFDANVTHAKVKEGHEIVGWDWDPQNTAPGLLVETHLLHGYSPHPRAPDWLTARLIERHLRGAGSVHWQDANQTGVDADAGTEGAPDADASPSANERPMKLGQRRLTFGDGWQSLGNFTWTDETTVQGQQGGTPNAATVHFQVQGARRFAAERPGGGRAVGVLLMGGFSYTGGGAFERVVHDPESSLGMAEIDPTSAESGGQNPTMDASIAPGQDTTPGFPAFALLVGLAFTVWVRRLRRDEHP